ncbi:tyrosine-type recombinase/integrase [Nocardioides sp. NPDC101246]|uniref:tyrosine-type recombinase/integrase n=1 Tax=Nocardioides sp. NPDC101246 TaxID=3364336 RepID=UPI003814AA3A
MLGQLQARDVRGARSALDVSSAGLTVADIQYDDGLIWVKRQTYPGSGGLVTKETNGRRKRPVPIIEQLLPELARLTEGRDPEARLIVRPRGGVITSASLCRATGWDSVVKKLGLAGLDRHALRHTALTWMADSEVPLDMLQRVAGHADPAVTQRYLHPDH